MMLHTTTYILIGPLIRVIRTYIISYTTLPILISPLKTNNLGDMPGYTLNPISEFSPETDPSNTWSKPFQPPFESWVRLFQWYVASSWANMAQLHSGLAIMASVIAGYLDVLPEVVFLDFQDRCCGDSLLGGQHQ